MNEVRDCRASLAPALGEVNGATVQESLLMVVYQRLEAALKAGLSGEVRFDNGMRAAYAADASNYRQVPIGVVLPRTVEDIVEATRVCASHGVPLLARGGATSLNGQAVNVAVVIDCSKYLRRIIAIDAQRRVARVEPGVVCDALRDAAEAHGLKIGRAHV